jgi:hypothetical protein
VLAGLAFLCPLAAVALCTATLLLQHAHVDAVHLLATTGYGDTVTPPETTVSNDWLGDRGGSGGRNIGVRRAVRLSVWGTPQAAFGRSTREVCRTKHYLMRLF